MDKMPKHKKVSLVNLYGEELTGILIPLSIKGTMDIEEYIENVKNELSDKSDDKIARYKKSLELENQDDESLFKDYVESKITTDLNKLNEEVTEERIKSQYDKRFKKLVEGKTREMVINEMAEMLMELEIRKQVLTKTVSRTLWNVLRKSDNLREHLFKDTDDLEESIDTEALINIFKEINENVVDEEDLKT
ncbi:MAG: hypothetical protein PHN69_04165 [Candidatus Pacebacteria bacterium]|nr:hypothetical protein [Candidatus Paceibacterota bacterium]